MKDEENVLALTCDPNDCYLVAGSTAGDISIFDISNYCTNGVKVSLGLLEDMTPLYM